MCYTPFASPGILRIKDRLKRGSKHADAPLQWQCVPARACGDKEITASYPQIDAPDHRRPTPAGTRKINRNPSSGRPSAHSDSHHANMAGLPLPDSYFPTDPFFVIYIPLRL